MLLREAIFGAKWLRQRRNGLDENSRGYMLHREADDIRDIHRVVVALDAQGRPLVYGGVDTHLREDLTGLAKDLRQHFQADERSNAQLTARLERIEKTLAQLEERRGP